MADYQWNPLTDEKKFEDLINDLCSEKYGLEFQIYGRKGQKQYGIDGSALTNDNKHILHQCKNKMISRNDSAIQTELLKDLEIETEAMVEEFIEKKGYILDRFIFANSYKRDTKLQDKADELSKQYSISIIIWSWDEISDMLEEYDDISKKYYEKLFKEEDGKKIDTNTYIERIDNKGGVINIYQGQSDKQTTIKYQEDLQERYTEIQELKKAIFSYYSPFGINFENFRKVESFSELFDILKKEGECLYCLLKELNTEYTFFEKYKNIDCEVLKEKASKNKEINGLILRVDLLGNNTKQCNVSGYLRFSSDEFEPLDVHENIDFDTIPIIIKDVLENRQIARNIELQFILPNELFNKNFYYPDQNIKIVKRLSVRIDNYNQLEINAIRYWQRNSKFYRDHQEDKLDNNFLHILDKDNYIDEFRELDSDKHICLLSSSCLSAKIEDIYTYGIPFAFYSSTQECDIVNNLDFSSQQVKNMKDKIFRFMRRNQSTHFIYDDYNDLEFLKIEGAEDDYL